MKKVAIKRAFFVSSLIFSLLLAVFSLKGFSHAYSPTLTTTGTVTYINQASTTNVSNEHGLGYLREKEVIHDEERVTLPFPLFFTPPSILDWRNVNETNWITPIRNQWSCGSCVAFGVLAAFEAMLKIQSNDPNLNIDLSEQYLFSCGGGSCRGWWIAPALNYLRDYGVPSESDCPYRGWDISCPGMYIEMYKIDDWTWIEPNVQTIQAFLQYGPVVATMAVYEDFDFYSGGIYRHRWGSPKGDHCITIIGYNNVEGYWICKNSWGHLWGEGGFFRIAFGECEIEDRVAAMTISKRVKILSHMSVMDDFGYHHVIGEIKNAGDDGIVGTYIIAKFWDVNNRLVEKKFGATLLWIIPPGVKAPFRVDYGFDKTKFSRITSYSFHIFYYTLSQVGLSKPSIKLEITSHGRYTDSKGFLYVSGELGNRGNDTNNVRVIFTGYNDGGEVVWVAASYANPQDLKKGQRASFDVIIYSKAIVPSIKNYALIAESSDYQSEPVFESQHPTTHIIRYVNQTIFTPSAYVKVIPDKVTYTLGETMGLAGEGMFNVPPWITTTWLNWPANVRIKDPSGEIVYNTIVSVYPPQPTTTFTKAYKIPTNAKTGMYTIEAQMTPAYLHWIIEEKAVIDEKTTSTITTITETETWLVAFYSMEVTVIDEFPIPQALLGITLILSLLALKKVTRKRRSKNRMEL